MGLSERIIKFFEQLTAPLDDALAEEYLAALLEPHHEAEINQLLDHLEEEYEKAGLGEIWLGEFVRYAGSEFWTRDGIAALLVRYPDALDDYNGDGKEDVINNIALRYFAYGKFDPDEKTPGGYTINIQDCVELKSIILEFPGMDGTKVDKDIKMQYF